MGRIYFNPKTGEFWEASWKSKKPPEGYQYTGINKDHRYPGHRYVAVSYYCPTCGRYHAYINLYGFLPLHAQMKMRWTEVVGCREASTLVDLARSMGGLRIHYDYVWKLREEGLLERWMEVLLRLDPRMRLQVVKRLLKGEDEDDVYAWVVSRQLH